jgi:steroid 5-alpha reductase family enzyme
MMIMGVFLHFGADCQKYYILQYKKKYINDGFFKWTRNPNYLGELLIYGSFVFCTKSIFCFLILCLNIFLLWIPRMLLKDFSLYKYNEFKYNQNYIFIPFIW